MKRNNCNCNSQYLNISVLFQKQPLNGLVQSRCSEKSEKKTEFLKNELSHRLFQNAFFKYLKFADRLL